MPKNASSRTVTSRQKAAERAGSAGSATGQARAEAHPARSVKKAPGRKPADGADPALVEQVDERPAKKADKGAKSSTRTTRTRANKSPRTAPPVPEGTDWSPAELAEVRADLESQLSALRDEYDRALADLSNLQQTANDGAGDDQADAGTKTFEREQEMSIAQNRLDLLTQMERAIDRIDAGTYGRCESCGRPIAKARLQAFPGATLCVECKQREERR